MQIVLKCLTCDYIIEFYLRKPDSVLISILFN